MKKNDKTPLECQKPSQQNEDDEKKMDNNREVCKKNIHTLTSGEVKELQPLSCFADCIEIYSKKQEGCEVLFMC